MPTNNLIKILNEFPDENIHYSLVSYNPCLTLEIIIANIEKNWEWQLLSKRGCINWKFVSEHLYIEWNWNILSTNLSITLKDISENPNQPWVWSLISKRSDLTIEFIREMKDKLNWIFLSLNVVFTKKIKLENPDLPWRYFFNINSPKDLLDGIPEYLDHSWVTRNKFVTWDIIKQNLDRGWDWEYISSDKEITFEDVVANLNCPWNWYSLSLNHSINIHAIINNQNYQWSWRGVSRRTDLTFAIINANMHLPWDWPYIVVPMRDVDENPQMPWKYLNIVISNGLTPEVLRKYKDKLSEADWRIISSMALFEPDFEFPMDIKGLSSNPNITYSLIANNLHLPWDFNLITQNHFGYDVSLTHPPYIKKMTKKMHDIIYEELIRVTCHPTRLFLQTDNISNDPFNFMYEQWCECEREAQSGALPMPKRLGALQK